MAHHYFWWTVVGTSHVCNQVLSTVKCKHNQLFFTWKSLHGRCQAHPGANLWIRFTESVLISTISFCSYHLSVLHQNISSFVMKKYYKPFLGIVSKIRLPHSDNQHPENFMILLGQRLVDTRQSSICVWWLVTMVGFFWAMLYQEEII